MRWLTSAIAFAETSNYFNKENKLNSLKQAESILLELAKESDDDRANEILKSVRKRIDKLSAE